MLASSTFTVASNVAHVSAFRLGCIRVLRPVKSANDTVEFAFLVDSLHKQTRCEMGGLVVHPNEPSPWYEFEMLNAGGGTGGNAALFLHYKVTRHASDTQLKPCRCTVNLPVSHSSFTYPAFDFRTRLFGCQNREQSG